MPAPSSPTARLRRLPVVLLCAAAVAAVVVAVVLAGNWRHAERVAALPSPPTVGVSPAVAEHLRANYVAATDQPTDADAVGALCVAYHADMFFALADRCYAIAADLDAADWRWLYYRALIHAERGGGAQLVAALREVVARAPTFAPAWLRLGDAEFKAGRYDAAAAVWQRATELPEPAREGAQPEHVVEVRLAAYASLGLARIALVRREASRARVLLEMVVTDAPHFSPAVRLLADSYRVLGHDRDAERALSHASRLPPFAPYVEPIVEGLARESRNATFLLRLASEANLATNGPWSEHLTRRAAEFDPDNPEVVVKLGRILRTFERNEEALQWFEKYHRLVPDDLQGLAHIGGCLSALGRYAEAESFLRRAVVGLDDPVTHYNLGLLLAVTGRLDEAVTEYERALERDARHSDARGNLAAVLARLGQLDRAARELERVLDYDAENPAARTNLALVFLQQGRTGAAVEQLQEVLRIAPGFAPAAEALVSLRGDSTLQ